MIVVAIIDFTKLEQRIQYFPQFVFVVGLLFG